MEIWQIIVKLLGLLLVLGGVVAIYDARIITKKLFSFGDQNTAVRWMKIIGVIVMLIGAGIVIFI